MSYRQQFFLSLMLWDFLGHPGILFIYLFIYLLIYFKKAGELPGYRSQVTLAPALKLGVFTSALQDDVNDYSVWTQSILEMLIPAFEQALAPLQPAPVVPSQPEL